MDIIAKKHIFLGFSGTLVAASWFSILFFGLEPGIDLRGGTKWEIAISHPQANEEAVQSVLKRETNSGVSVKRAGEAYLVLLPPLSEEDHTRYLTALSKEFGNITEKNFSSIGPTVGAELKRKSLFAVGAVLCLISGYIAWAFRKVSRPIASWKYGVVTLATLFHDVSIPAGLFALLGALGASLTVDTNFITALLVVIGFSVHDTIVVFDRIREHLAGGRERNLGTLVNASVRETFARSVNTSLTLVLVLAALMAVGPPSLFSLLLTLLVGTVFGTYSSIFVASPLLYLWGKSRA